MKTALLIIHVLSGSLALLSGLIAMLAAKGKRLHNTSGIVYTYSMYVSTLLGALMASTSGNHFLMAIGLFSFYLVYAGASSIRFWRLKTAYNPKLKDWLVLLFFAVLAFYMVGSPIVKMVMAGRFYFSILAFFGFILAVAIYRDWKMFLNADNFQPRNRKWLIRHIGMMGGSYISAVTAFAVNNIVIAQNWLVWILPTVVGTILITRASNKWRKKMALTVAIFIGLTSASAATEIRIQGKVLATDSTPVAFANIGIVGTSVGTISNEKGAYVLYIPQADADDSIRISHLGYHTKTFAVEQLKRNSMVLLDEKVNTLKTVEISAKPSKIVVKGLGRTNTFMHTNYAISGKPYQNLGAAIGRAFSVGKGGHLKEFKFYVSTNTFDTVWLRLNFHEMKFLEPGVVVNSEPIILQLYKSKDGWISVDLSDYDLYFTEKVFVSLEWIKHSRKGNYLSMPIAMPMPGFTHYYRFGSQNKWKVYPAMATPMQLVMAQE